MQPGFLYLWPEDDLSLWKLIQKPIGEKWGAFRVLGTSTLPMGDFDSVRPPTIPEAHRTYKTHKGWRVMYTGHYAPPIDWMLDRMEEHGADKAYVHESRRRRYYAARVDPKYPFPYLGFDDWAVTSFVGEIGESHPFWEEFIAIHDDLTRANSNATLLV